MIFNFKAHGSKTALIGEDCSFSYSMLNKECENLAQYIGKRKLVFVLTKNSIASLLGHLACLNFDNVPLLLSAHMDAKLLTNLLVTYSPNYIWAPKEMAKNFKDYEIITEKFDYALLKNSQEENIELNPELAMLLPTSGSTGSPKLVRHSYENLKANIAAIIKYLGIDKSSRAITTLPINYTYGLTVVHIHLMAGACL